jgi:cobalt-zinc-cadmium efflux system outer membrane protein
MTSARFTFLVAILIWAAPLATAAEPTLNVDRLVEEALQNNPEILAAREKAAAVREKVPQAGALDDPILGLGIVNLPTNFSFSEEDMTMKEVSVSQKVPFPGK